jgi:hypothetical protein
MLPGKTLSQSALSHLFSQSLPFLLQWRQLVQPVSHLQRAMVSRHCIMIKMAFLLLSLLLFNNYYLTTTAITDIVL